MIPAWGWDGCWFLSLCDSESELPPNLASLRHLVVCLSMLSLGCEPPTKLRPCLKCRFSTGTYRREWIAIDGTTIQHKSEVTKKRKEISNPLFINSQEYFHIFQFSADVQYWHRLLSPRDSWISTKHNSWWLRGVPGGAGTAITPWRKSHQEIQGTNCVPNCPDVWATGIQKAMWSEAHGFSSSKTFFFFFLLLPIK